MRSTPATPTTPVAFQRTLAGGRQVTVRHSIGFPSSFRRRLSVVCLAWMPEHTQNIILPSLFKH